MLTTTRGLFRLQIASDLHLNINAFDENIIQPNAPYLAIAGDIAELKNRHVLLPFLKNICSQFQKVFYVMGNHEYYYEKKFQVNATKEKLLEQLRADVGNAIPNLFILDNEVHHLKEENVMIAGCTLWTHVPDDAIVDVQYGMNDYSQICTLSDSEKVSRLRVSDTNRLHQDSINFLNFAKELSTKLSVKKFIVMSHHAPLSKGTSCPFYETPGRKLSHGFSTDLSNWINKNEVDAWIFGHTHWCCDFEFGNNNTRIIANQYGYRSPKR